MRRLAEKNQGGCSSPIGGGDPTLTLVAGHTAEIAAWVADHIPHVTDFGPCEAIGILTGNRLIAGVVYHDYQPMFGTIQLSMAAISPMWARQETIAGLLQYPFLQLGVYKVFTATPIDNIMALRVNTHIGLKQEAVLNSMFGKGRHGVIMRMLEPDFNRLYASKING